MILYRIQRHRMYHCKAVIIYMQMERRHIKIKLNIDNTAFLLTYNYIDIDNTACMLTYNYIDITDF